MRPSQKGLAPEAAQPPASYGAAPPTLRHVVPITRGRGVADRLSLRTGPYLLVGVGYAW
ncbi:MAG: hypothetical protein JWO52_360, partial [Gammaproteobacteria bacterium]|nr:hypothetical protein [Gammaproteobacteria bacterium]